MKRFLIRVILILGLLYACACGYMYFFQESFIFHPHKIDTSVKIELLPETEEISLKTKDGAIISALLCKADDTASKNKLVFYLHGNTGNLLDQKEAAQLYTSLGFDFFCMDYRTFGKSNGKLSDEATFFEDARTAFRMISERYEKENIVVVGYSLGTASAAMITSEYKPSRLVLIAPYFSLVDMTKRSYPWIPSQLLKYPFETHKFVRKIHQTPVLLVHGDKDQMIPYECSKDLSELLNDKSTFLTLNGQTHDYFERNSEFVSNLKSFLK
jgi:pimeloyl-ACP methyl ester carboxylesterase